MPGWTITTLPTGFEVKHVTDPSVAGDWWEVKGYGAASGPLDPGSASFRADLDAFVDGTLPAEYGAARRAAMLQMRNRWLAQTDPYLLQPAQFPQDMPADVQAAITGNLATVIAWRQQLRDYPSTVTDWAKPPALPAPPTILLPSGRELIIVT